MIRRMDFEKFKEVKEKFEKLYPDTNLNLTHCYDNGTLCVSFTDLYIVEDDDDDEEAYYGECCIDIDLLIQQLEDLKKLL